MSTRVIIVGIGGSSSAGKTTLSNQLSAVLPNCKVVHQDDYWSSPEECVIHPVYNEPYLEEPSTAINWPLFRTNVQQLKVATKCSDVSKQDEEGSGSDVSYDDKTSEDEPLPYYGELRNEVVADWSQRFRELNEEWRSRGIQLRWCIVEGWHLYYDPAVVEELDIRLLIRCSTNVIRKRRAKRAYKQQDGSMRVDPPYYWDHFAYPAYVRSHRHLFHGEMETGPLSAEAESKSVILLEGEGTEQNLSCSELFQHAAASILHVGRSELGLNELRH